MDCISTRMPYRQTNAFTKLILDYLDGDKKLTPFFEHPPSLQGVRQAIEKRKKYPVDRNTLAEELNRWYQTVDPSAAVTTNIKLLGQQNTFTVTTAHQPNIFTGPLYSVYKILHVIRLAEHLNESLPQYKFVPVYYMGSEDADLDELGHVYINGEKYTWETKQTGAVGRMKVDKELVKLIQRIEGQVAVEPHGDEILSLIKDCYKEGTTIQEATFRLVNALFGQYGLIVLIPDSAAFKKQMIPVFEDDLLNQSASGIVESTAQELEAAGYKVQANPREVNLFYLKDNTRERIIKQDSSFRIQHSKTTFTREEIVKELSEHPERFSPNVILRGLYQETILPNLVFIGGGGETAYWLQLKALFDNYKVPFPVLVLRNSFLLIEKKWAQLIAKLNFLPEDFFMEEQQLMNKLVQRESKQVLKLNGNLSAVEQLYESFKQQAAAVDITLEKHTEALKVQSLKRLQELEKKMLRAERRKFSDQQRQVHWIKEQLFPQNGLQERIDNFIPYYARRGKDFIHMLYKNSLSLEQEFVILAEK